MLYMDITVFTPLKMYQVEGTIGVLVRILSSKWTRKVQCSAVLQSTVLSRILLARDYADMKSRTGHIT